MRCEPNLFSTAFPGVGAFVLALAAQAVGYSILLAALESSWFQRAWRSLASRTAAWTKVDDETEDADVVAERQRVIAAANRSSVDAVRLLRLRKAYGSKMAVQSCSLAVSPGECFGLLGVNGAGKTTTFKMLTGEVLPTSGEMAIAGCSVGSDRTAAARNCGYVPQFGGLIGTLTAREHLELVAALRGIAGPSVDVEVRRLIALLGLGKQTALVSQFSGGNRRKLSMAMALVGSPPVVLLDEPTTGMDPRARRALWDTVLSVSRGGSAVVLTTHSMEECEALCSRIAIMVDGKVAALGSQQHLKERYGVGHTLTVMVSGEEAVATYITRLQAEVGETATVVTGCTVATTITGRIRVADLFRFVERLKGEQLVQQYSLGGTTLEQVFLQFARGAEQ